MSLALAVAAFIAAWEKSDIERLANNPTTAVEFTLSCPVINYARWFIDKHPELFET